jgi:hypothetical protein
MHLDTPAANCFPLVKLAPVFSPSSCRFKCAKSPSIMSVTHLNCVVPALFLQSFYSFFSTGIWTQGFTLARQALYHAGHTSFLLALVISQRRSHIFFFCPCWPGHSSPFYSSHVAGMTGVPSTPNFLLVMMGSHKLFVPGCPQTMILLISASRIAGIISISHHVWHRVLSFL